jgi:hypothetical protein
VPALTTFVQLPPPLVLEFPPQPLSEARPVTKSSTQARLRIDLRLRKGRNKSNRAKATGPRKAVRIDGVSRASVLQLVVEPA